MSFKDMTTLGSVVKCFDHKRIPMSTRERRSKQGQYPYYGAAGIIDHVNKPLFSGLYLLMGEDGSVIKEDGTPVLQLVSGEFWVNNHAHVLQGETDLDTRFLYYALGNTHIQGFVTGAVQPKLNQANMNRIPVYFPEKSTRERIVEILSALDDKIELNRQTNVTLEAIAQAIFKEWFVDFNYPGATDDLVDSPLGPIPKDWRVGSLGEVIETVESGSRPKGGVGYLSEGIPSVGAENIIGLGVYDYSKEKYISEEFFSQMKNGIVKSGDVLLYKDGASLGRKSLFMDDFPHKTCAINEHVFILRSNQAINQVYLFFWLDQGFMTENIINLNANSAQPGINRTGISSLPILIPDRILLNEFEQSILPLLRKLFNNCKESLMLSQIRDLLLPKLMSGEVEI